MKRKITQSQKEFLERELAYLRSVDADFDSINLSNHYEVNGQKSSSMQTILWVGAALVGIGILSLIASNWAAMHSSLKFLLVFLGVAAFYTAGWRTETLLPRTSRSLYYIGVILFGAGIILIGQAFHLGGGIMPAFLFWSIGILPAAYYLKDKLLLSFSIVLLYVYNFEIVFDGTNPVLLFILIPAIFMIIHFALGKSPVVFFLNSLLTLQFVHTQLWHYGLDPFFVIVLLFAIGIMFSIKPIRGYKNVSKTLGYLMQGAYGLALTFPSIWGTFFSDAFSGIAAIIFGVMYGLYIIYMVKEGDLFPILILSALIFRFYIDLSYDFLPRSLFFIIGGLVLIIFGVWFEWRRREEVNKDENAKQ